MADEDRLICGMMSGTSADGVDAALVRVAGRGAAMTATPVAHAYVPFDAALRTQVLDVRQRGDARLADLAEIGRRVTRAHVDAFRAIAATANVTSTDVAAIAAHGQTLFHAPPNTIQLFDPSLLAFETGCAVVSDFRRADLAAGGQGAPLVPFADWILFRHPTKTRAILNVGGIANVTSLTAGGAIDEVIAFDTGPGNCLSDWVIRTYYPELPGYDAGGAIAAEGVVLEEIVDGFVARPFFKRPPPRSTDGPQMVAAFQAAIRNQMPIMVNPPQGMRGALVRTAIAAANRCIWDAIDLLGARPDELIVAGGGTRNVALMNALHDEPRRAATRILTADQVGIATDAREAIAFALLGAATLDGEPSNVPSATGASRMVVLGSITPSPVARAFNP